MSSLRLALKMSMAGAPKTAAPAKTEFDSIPDPPVGKCLSPRFEIVRKPVAHIQQLF